MIRFHRFAFALFTAASLALVACGGDEVLIGEHGRNAEEGEPCGDTFCEEGTGCCNASCGICTEPDEACLQLQCGDEGDDGGPGEDTGEPCGPVTCGAGEVCCNASCGICTEPDGACLTIQCEPCDAMDAEGAGSCRRFFGYAWDGAACVPINGCSCEGAHCGHLFEDRGECERAYAECLEDGGGGDREIVTDRCARTTGDSCSTDADCATGGCGSELCYNPAEHDTPPETMCDCVAPDAACGCVEGECVWWR